MIPVEFVFSEAGGATMSAGWYAMPQVPSKGETVTLPAIHPTTVKDVGWKWGTVPATAAAMRDANLNGSNRLMARVWLDEPEVRHS